MPHRRLEPVTPAEAGTLYGLFLARLSRSPDTMAYTHYDVAAKEWVDTTWSQVAREVGRWQAALRKEGLKRGDRVGLMLRNGRDWVVFDLAAQGLGLVVVPAFTNDRVENVAYIARKTGIQLLLVEGRRQWLNLQEASDGLPDVRRIVSVGTVEAGHEDEDPRLVSLNEWLSGLDGDLQPREGEPEDLATIVFTSGTTGQPKGVMLSHANILSNAWAAGRCSEFDVNDAFLSFLPLSHMLERTGGYYLPMMVGARVAFARSVMQLAEDFRRIRPTVLISVPRIYERIHARVLAQLEKASPGRRRLFELTVETGWRRYQRHQGRAGWSPAMLLWPALKPLVADNIRNLFGGRLKFAISGGAPMSPEISRVFLACGVPVLQGYGMTELSPVVSVNRPRDNVPESIGKALDGIEVDIGEKDELRVRGPNVMQGYWQDEGATAAILDGDGWLSTGDTARIDEEGHIFLTGRIKEIIVLANGEKVPPGEMEMAISRDPLFEQVMVVGEGRAFLSALVVLDRQHWKDLLHELALDTADDKALGDRSAEKAVLRRIAAQIEKFPGYAQIRRAALTLNPWTIEDGLLTPTLKLRRAQILGQFQDAIDALYTEYRA
ncbi:MAG: long-chain fatty acid--CoA ligase [Gammaproteobacteria bacterium]|jgi:long-chain acyl-CoA synthetase|nr:long-chain fatty acid--CoA ligase [Gammaproteobacteria bacterium]